MSATGQVDEKVVKLGFDNKEFEQNISQSMSTLDKLKEKLNFNKSVESMDSLNASIDEFDASGAVEGVNRFKSSFSALEVFGMTAMYRISNAAIDTGKKIVNALTITPIKTGFEEYETQINAIQTVLANTESKGTTLKDVNKALRELNTYADKTIYNFTEMTRNIGTFTAAGVGLKQSTAAIQGIANLAAVSGSNSQQASTAMYQLSQALAAGTVKLQDWNSVVNAGMGGQVFQEQLKKTARAHGVAVDAIIKKEGSFRESLQKGWITSEILTETLSKMTKTGAAEYLAKTTGKNKENIKATKEHIIAIQKDIDEGKLSKKAYDDLAQSLSKTGKISKKEAKSILLMADTAENAATKVKTFTQLKDTLTEAAQSGWTQTWEILIGDFEEAKSLWTSISDAVSGWINDSSQMRNNLLQGWKDLGGRKDLIKGLKNAFMGLVDIIKPIGQAFREIFPPTTAKQLKSLSTSFVEFTKKMRLNDEQMQRIKDTFTGLFSIIKIVIAPLKLFINFILKLSNFLFPLFNMLTLITGSIGRFVTGLFNAVSGSSMFLDIVKALTTTTENMSKKFDSLVDSFNKKLTAPGLSYVRNIIDNLLYLVGRLGSGLRGLEHNLADSFSSAFRNGDASVIFDLINASTLGAILVRVKKFFDELTKGSVEQVSNILKAIKEIPGSIVNVLKTTSSTLTELQKSTNAKVIKEISIAIGILAGSLFLLAMIDPSRLSGSIAALASVAGVLTGTMYALNELAKGMTNTTMTQVVKISALMTTLSGSLFVGSIGFLIGAKALDVVSKSLINFSKVSWNEVGQAVTLMIGLAGALKIVGKNIAGGIGLLLVAESMNVVSKSLVELSKISFDSLTSGFMALTGALGIMATILSVMGHNIMGGLGLLLASGSLMAISEALVALDKVKPEKLTQTVSAISFALFSLAGAMKIIGMNVLGAAAVVIASNSLIVIASAFSLFEKIDWNTIGRGTVAMSVMLGSLAAAMNGIKGAKLAAPALLLASLSLGVITASLSVFSKLKTEDVAKGVMSISATLFVLAAAMNDMTGTIMGAAALAIGASAIATLAGSFKLLSSVGVVGMIASIVATSVAIGLISLASMKLQGAIPFIYSFSSALGAFGFATSLLGAGLLASSAGIASWVATLGIAAKSGGSAIKSLVTSVTTFLVAFSSKIGEILYSAINGIAKYVPIIIRKIFEYIVNSISTLTEYVPIMVKQLSHMLVAVFDALAEEVPKLIPSFIHLLTVILTELGKCMANLDIKAIKDGAIAVGIFAVITHILAGVIGSIPMAMLGLLGIGALLAELGVILAVIGDIFGSANQLEFIQNGGAVLEAIGTALGRFVGGIAGGIAQGVMASLPAIGESLSDFMTTAKPFFDGVKNISSDSMQGVYYLAKAIGYLTGAEILDSIGKFVTGDSSLSSMGKELAEFGPYLSIFSAYASGIDSKALTKISKSMSSLFTALGKIPNSGGLVSLFTGDNSIESFGESLGKFGEALYDFALEAGDLNTDGIKKGTDAIKSISSAMNSVIKVDLMKIEDFIISVQKIGDLKVDTEALETTADTMKKSVKSMTSSISKNLSKSTKSVNSSFTSMFEGAADGIKDSKTTVTSAVSSLMSTMNKTVKKNKNALSSAFKDMMNGVKATLKTYRDDFEAVGKYVAQGLVKGMEEKKITVENMGITIGKAAAAGAKKGAKVKSPSRLTMETGRFIGEGLVLGMQQQMKNISKSGSSLGEAATNAVSLGVGKIQSLLLNDVDSTPVIRPVMDLSAVAEGAASIGGMLNSDPTLSLLPSINGAMSTANMMNKLQNGATNDDVVRAINELKTNISGSSDTYNINGVTYDDGSNIANAVSDIVRAAKIERRS